MKFKYAMAALALSVSVMTSGCICTAGGCGGDVEASIAESDLMRIEQAANRAEDAAARAESAALRATAAADKAEAIFHKGLEK